KSLDSILDEVKQYQAKYVTVTGGEPLAQKQCINLLKQLCDQGYDVSLETSGAMDVSQVDPRVSKVMDLKTPGSGEESKNQYENIRYLSDNDQVKFVICNREDYEWAAAKLEEYQLADKCHVLFSPIHGELEPSQLAEWILQDNLAVRFQLQLHKYLWGEEQGR
ncbi:MAG: radical SAM protein, partial [Gammaproteobacteria bacterium]